MAKTNFNRFTNKPTDPLNFYILPADLSSSIIESQSLSVCTDLLAGYLVTIHDKVLNFPKFRKYIPEDKQEMKSYSIYRFLKRGLFTIDAAKNPFSYITSGAVMNYMNYLKGRLKRQKDYQDLVADVMRELKQQGLYESFAEQIDYYNNMTNREE